MGAAKMGQYWSQWWPWSKSDEPAPTTPGPGSSKSSTSKDGSTAQPSVRQPLLGGCGPTNRRLLPATAEVPTCQSYDVCMMLFVVLGFVYLRRFQFHDFHQKSN